MTSTGTFTTTASTTATFTASRTHTPTVTPSKTATSTPVPPTATFTSTPTPNENKGVVIYPNPVSGPTVNVIPKPYSGISDVEVRIFTTTFRKVNEENFSNVPSGVAVTLTLIDERGTPLANGLYYLVVKTDSGTAIGKLLVLK